MPEPFDPYQQWLGIAKHEQPPNHYRLLGVGTLMDDRDAIGNAADRQMNFVRTFQLGQHRDLSQQILRELAQAKLCLLNAESKTAYDVQLRQQTSGPPPAAPPPPAPPAPAGPPSPTATRPPAPAAPSPIAAPSLIAAPVQPVVSALPTARSQSPTRTFRSERRSGLPQWVWIAVAIVITLAAFVWMISRIAESRRAARSRQDRPNQTRPEIPDEPAGPSVAQNPDGTVTCVAALAVPDSGNANIVTEGSDTFITDLEKPRDGVHWTFVLEKGQRGIFKVLVDYACPQGAEGGKFSISVNDKAVKGTHAVYPTGGATTFVRAEIGHVKIQKLERNILKLAVETQAPSGTTIMNVRAIRLKLVQKGVGG